MAEQTRLDAEGLRILLGIIQNKFVKKIQGKDLSSNDFTDELLLKVVNQFSGNYNDLINKPNLSVYLKEADVSNLIAQAIVNYFQYKGTVQTSTALPSIRSVGDVYKIIDTSKLVFWNGTQWEEFGGTGGSIDPDLFVKKEELVVTSEEEIISLVEEAMAEE